MSGKTVINVILGILVLEIICVFLFGGVGKNSANETEPWFSIGPVNVEKYGMRLESIGTVEKYSLENITKEHGAFWAIDIMTAKMTLVIDAIILFIAFFVRFSMKIIPGRTQGFIEIVVDFFRSIIQETLGEHGARHIPTLLTLFMFVWFSNIIGIVPYMGEPTRDINVPLGLMLVMIFIVHYEAIRIKGIKKYTKEYFEPFFVMFPLNVIGEFAKGVSLSFRLFGNICGGAIIIVVISFLVKYTLLPVGLNLFFGLFVGTIQAFVFTMLSMTYIAVAIAES